ncbi:translation machinery-associated protein 16 isoform X1 [Tachypleus tridentatus]|uniref:translation machinery-associated protein 16 isoform X1 n=1 Tax=Tachypleus tridentatus TaxID=6853 RepID=UPI003FD1036F
MPKGLKHKVTIQKLIHPNSRKALQLSRKEHRGSKVQRKKEETNLKQQIKLKKLLWFKENLEEKDYLSPAEVFHVIERYLHRFDEEIEQIEIINGIKGRQSGQHISRKDSIRFTLEQENREFESTGLEIPDLLDMRAYQYFRCWSGDAKYLPAITLKKVSKKIIRRSDEECRSYNMRS